MSKIFLAFILASSFTFAAPPPKAKLANELLTGNLQGSVEIIVQWKVTPTNEHDQKVIRRGGALNRHLNLIKAGSYSIPATALADLANEPDVAYITPDRPVKGALDYTAAAVNAKPLGRRAM